MKIEVGNIKLTAKDGSAGLPQTTIIILDFSHDPDNHVFSVDAKELKAAIEVLEKTCWRPSIL